MRAALPQPHRPFNLSFSFLACAYHLHKPSVVMLPCLIVSNEFPSQVEGGPALSWQQNLARLTPTSASISHSQSHYKGVLRA